MNHAARIRALEDHLLNRRKKRRPGEGSLIVGAKVAVKYITFSGNIDRLIFTNLRNRFNCRYAA